MNALTDCANTSSYHFTFGYFNGQTQIRYTNVAMIVEQYVLWLTITIDNSLLMQMLQTAYHFGRIETGPCQIEAWLTAHIVNVEFQIAT